MGLRVALGLALWTAVSCLSVCTARGQERCAPEILDNRSAVVEHNGASGTWFRTEIARCLLSRVAVSYRAQELLETLEAERGLLKSNAALAARALALAESEAAELRGVLEASMRAKREAEESRDAWHRSRALWFSVGALATAGIVALSAWALSSAD